ncbi:hypothetical protein PkP19E3_35480 (plasmid) [Pseudomonas koreensis]|nr:hypothetical protein PkP19E3_35480 [Pseudomonas koreensis]
MSRQKKTALKEDGFVGFLDALVGAIWLSWKSTERHPNPSLDKGPSLAQVDRSLLVKLQVIICKVFLRPLSISTLQSLGGSGIKLFRA